MCLQFDPGGGQRVKKVGLQKKRILKKKHWSLEPKKYIFQFSIFNFYAHAYLKRVMNIKDPDCAKGKCSSCFSRSVVLAVTILVAL